MATKFEDPPPPYQDTRSSPIRPSNSRPAKNKPFPQDFGVYHASGSFSDLCIAKSADSPAQFHISTHNHLSSKPSIVLHSASYPASTPIATADFHSFSSAIDVTVGSEKFALLRDKIFSTSHFFDFPVQVGSTGTMDRFEWRSSSGPEVQAMNGRSRGMKLVQVRTGRVVAVWTRPNSGTKKKGKMRFMARESGELGEQWEIVAVISILAIIEKARRTRSNGAAAAGGAAA